MGRLMERWQAWAAKVDELSLRERAMVFLASAAVLVLLVHVAALQPLLRDQRFYLERMRVNQGQLKSINDDLLKSAQSAAADPQAPKRKRIVELESRLAAAERQLAKKRTEAQLTPAQVVRLLQDVLGRNRKLRLQSLRVLPEQGNESAPSGAPPAAGLLGLLQGAPPAPPAQNAQLGALQGLLPGAPAPSPGNAQAVPPVQKPPPAAAPKPAASGVYRHLVEVRMAGTFLELLKYLEEVEALPWRLVWTEIQMSVAAHPQIELRATLSTTTASPTLLTF